MKSRKAAVPIALAVGALVIAMGAAHAESPGHGWRGERGQKFKLSDENLQELNLTPEQTEQVKKQCDENKSAMRELRRNLKDKQRELREELDKPETDKEKLAGIVSELKSLEAQRIDQKVNAVLQMKATLTPEQFQKLNAQREKRGKGKRGPGKEKGAWKKCAGPDKEADVSPDEQGTDAELGESDAE